MPGLSRRSTTGLLSAKISISLFAVNCDEAKDGSIAQDQIAERGLTDAELHSPTIALKTGSSSPGELEMTLSTSDVAVCCSSDSESSRCGLVLRSNSRTFSMAITAWSAKVVTNSICLSVNGKGVRR